MGVAGAVNLAIYIRYRDGAAIMSEAWLIARGSMAGPLIVTSVVNHDKIDSCAGAAETGQQQRPVFGKFLADYVNGRNHQLEASLNDDTWIVTLDKGDIYEVPRAAIDGG